MTERRESAGGGVVRESLAEAGVTAWPDRVSLVETARSRRALDAILVQSAWNVVPMTIFAQLLRPYPARMQAIASARRALAQAQIRRARRVVTLTESVAALVEQTTGRTPIVAPVTAGLQDWADLAEQSAEQDIGRGEHALVVGTVSWFKRPWLALDVIHRHRPHLREIVFAGGDDGSGCWDVVQHHAAGYGLTVRRVQVPHAQMAALYRSAGACVLPSALESLGFGLVEALLACPDVIAARIPPHAEMAARLGVSPSWITADGLGFPSGGRPVLGVASVTDEWRSVADALGLSWG
ncbi:MAG: glycosyltransferase [Tetrasphaera sp.]